MDNSTPRTSSLTRRGLRDSGTATAMASTPTTTIGTLIRNTEPHQKWSSSRPPVTGPIAIPMPTAAAHRPMARPRSAGSKTLVMIARVCGMTAAPPKPIAARARMSWSGVRAYEEMSEARPNSSIPIISMRLRPIRSPSTPKVNSSPANTSV
jgi:hypothetical protein